MHRSSEASDQADGLPWPKGNTLVPGIAHAHLHSLQFPLCYPRLLFLWPHPTSSKSHVLSYANLPEIRAHLTNSVDQAAGVTQLSLLIMCRMAVPGLEDNLRNNSGAPFDDTEDNILFGKARTSTLWVRMGFRRIGLYVWNTEILNSLICSFIYA